MNRSQHPTTSLQPDKIDGLRCWWDFQEPAGNPRISKGRYAYALQEQLGPIQRADEGVLGLTHSLHIQPGQWLRLPRSECPGLNLHGQQPLTLVAWIQRRSERPWQFIAGMWDERDRRQYGLFTSGTKQYDAASDSRVPAFHQAHGYLSDTGGKSPEKEACFSYATGATRLEADRWYCIASTWNGKTLRIYCNGALDTNGSCNPIPFTGLIFNGDSISENRGDYTGLPGADFTVGQHGHVLWSEYPNASGPGDEGFSGLIGSLCVYDRALEPSTIAALAAAGRPEGGPYSL